MMYLVIKKKEESTKKIIFYQSYMNVFLFKKKKGFPFIECHIIWENILKQTKEN